MRDAARGQMFMVARAGDFPRGIQIWIPIARGPSFDDTHGWTEQLSRAVGGAVPELVSWEWNVRDRDGLARLDYTAPC